MRYIYVQNSALDIYLLNLGLIKTIYLGWDFEVYGNEIERLCSCWKLGLKSFVSIVYLENDYDIPRVKENLNTTFLSIEMPIFHLIILPIPVTCLMVQTQVYSFRIKRYVNLFSPHNVPQY